MDNPAQETRDTLNVCIPLHACARAVLPSVCAGPVHTMFTPHACCMCAGARAVPHMHAPSQCIIHTPRVWIAQTVRCRSRGSSSFSSQKARTEQVEQWVLRDVRPDECAAAGRAGGWRRLHAVGRSILTTWANTQPCTRPGWQE